MPGKPPVGFKGIGGAHDASLLPFVTSALLIAGACIVTAYWPLLRAYL